MPDQGYKGEVIVAVNRPLIQGSFIDLAERHGARSRISTAVDMDSLKALVMIASASALAIVCMRLPGLHGLRGIHNLRYLFPSLKLLVICEQSARSMVNDIMAAGASGVVTLDSSVDEISRAMRIVGAGSIFTPLLLQDDLGDPVELEASDPSHAAHAIRAGGSALGLEELTERQAEVLHWLVRGASNKEIARRIDISPHTVNMHVRAIFRALGVHSRQEALFKIASQRSEGDAPFNHEAIPSPRTVGQYSS